MSSHKEILDKIHQAICKDIDIILKKQVASPDYELDSDDSDKLLEYGKYLRTDKSDSKDLNKLSDEKLQELIDKELKKDTK